MRLFTLSTVPQKQIVNVETLMHSAFKENLAADKQVACRGWCCCWVQKMYLHLPSLPLVLKFLRHGEPFGEALA